MRDTSSLVITLNSSAGGGAPSERVMAALKSSPELAIRGQAKRKNLVYLYLESIEQSLFDEQHFPGLLPELNKIRRESIDFTNVRQVDSASWTIAGLVASQCSVPLHSPFSRSQNTLAITDSFMAGALCLGDVLENQGYSNYFMGGANPQFAGKDLFLRTHGYVSVEGKDTLLRQQKDRKYKHGWGLYDDSLYSQAKKKFLTLSKKNSPFTLTLLTLDTHHPNGHFSRSCQPYEGPDQDTMTQAVHCADQLASAFIRFIRNSEYSENTEIVVMSDHLAMRNTMWEKIKRYPEERKLLFFINRHKTGDKTLSTAGTHYDVAPTILDLMGFKGGKRNFGLGQSLLRGNGFLAKQGEDINIGDHPSVRQAVLQLWDQHLGEAKNGITIEKNGRFVDIGGQRLHLHSDGWMGKAAALIRFDGENSSVVDIQLWPHQKGLIDADLSMEILAQPDQIFLAIGQGKYLRGLVYDTQLKPDKMVYFFGAAGGFYRESGSLSKKQGVSIEQDVLHNSFAHAGSVDDEILYLNRFRVMSYDGIWEQIRQRYFAKAMQNVDAFELLSCTFTKCDSALTVNGDQYFLDRGISVFGISRRGKLNLVDHIDGCAGRPFGKVDPLTTRMSKRDEIVNWLLVAHDTVACKEQYEGLQTWLVDSPFEQLKSIEFREPYIGVHSALSSQTLEYRGSGRNQLHLSYDGTQLNLR